MDWKPIDTAPKDGTAVQIEIPGHGSDFVAAYVRGLVDEGGRDCGGWMIIEDQEPPDDWTDGVCWSKNEDGIPSTLPTRWKPLPK